MKRVAAFCTLALLAACARTEEANLNPDENETTAVEQVRDTESGEQETALGEWRRSLQEAQPALEFGPAGTTPLLSMICAERRGLIIQRHGAVASGAAPTMAISVGGQGRQLPVTPAQGTTPMLRASVPAGDALLAQLGSAQGPITFRSGDGTPLILPASPMIAEFVQGCATGTVARTAASAGDAAGNEAAPTEEPAAGNQPNAAAPAR